MKKRGPLSIKNLKGTPRPPQKPCPRALYWHAVGLMHRNSGSAEPRFPLKFFPGDKGRSFYKIYLQAYMEGFEA